MGRSIGKIRTLGMVLMVVVAGNASASAQGTKDRNSGTQTSSSVRGGVGTNSSPDSMGGAFKGTGTPTYGTSSGMGSAKKSRH